MKKSKNRTTQPAKRPTKPTILHQVRTSPHHQTKIAKWLKVTVVSALALLVVLGGVFGYLKYHLGSLPADKQAQKKAAQLVSTLSEGPKLHTVTSTLGFALKYDTQTFSATGQVTDPKSTSTYVFGQEYKDNDLATQREYSIVKLHLPDKKNGSYSFTAPEMSIVTNIRKDYFTSKQALPENVGKSELDILTQATTQTVGKNGYTVQSTTNVTVNDAQYRKVLYTKTDNSYGVKTTDTQVYYLTVQHDRPYTISISGLHDKSSAELPLFEAVIKTVTYGQPDATKLSFKTASPVVVASSSDSVDLPEGTSNVPNTLDPATILNVVARNQPAVVRVGTITCADITLALPDGSKGLALSGACTGEIGSGSFVSKDGYVATNGHVTDISTPSLILGYIALVSDPQEQRDRLRAVLGYLVKSGAMSATDVEALVRDAQSGDQTALQKLDAIGTLVPENAVTVANQKRSYVLQTSDDPIKFQTSASGKLSWNYTKTNISATYVDSDIDPESLRSDKLPSEDSTHSDVAILKAKGKFPTVNLGSVKGLKAGDELTAIGFPAFVDGGTDTKQQHTVPSVTQGTVRDTALQATRTLIITNVPIAQGNSGGPAFDSNGQQIGLNTYGISGCADNKCFGDGIVRDIADYQELVSKNHIHLASDSSITNDWAAGLDAISRGDYRTASGKFQAVEAAYPGNYLVQKFLELANSNAGISSAATSDHAALNVVEVGLGFATILAVAAGVILVIFLVRGHHTAQSVGAPTMAVAPGTYMPPNPVVAPTQPVAPGSVAPVQPTGAMSPSPPQQPSPPSNTPPEPPVPPVA
jgi:hypothetical protein